MSDKTWDLAKIGSRRLISDYLSLAWIFDKWWEKLVLILLGGTGFWTIALYLWGLVS